MNDHLNQVALKFNEQLMWIKNYLKVCMQVNMNITDLHSLKWNGLTINRTLAVCR